MFIPGPVNHIKQSLLTLSPVDILALLLVDVLEMIKKLTNNYQQLHMNSILIVEKTKN